jgi:hypothetical protein
VRHCPLSDRSETAAGSARGRMWWGGATGNWVPCLGKDMPGDPVGDYPPSPTRYRFVNGGGYAG